MTVRQAFFSTVQQQVSLQKFKKTPLRAPRGGEAEKHSSQQSPYVMMLSAERKVDSISDDGVLSVKQQSFRIHSFGYCRDAMKAPVNCAVGTVCSLP